MFFQNWKDVKFKEVLVRGRIPFVLYEYQEKPLLFSLIKPNFSDDELTHFAENVSSFSFDLSQQNDKYYSVTCSKYSVPSGLSISCIFPATSEDVENVLRYNKMFFFRETKEIYDTMTLKWLEEHAEELRKKNQWIRNLFDDNVQNKKEKILILHEDFVLAVNPRWIPPTPPQESTDSSVSSSSSSEKKKYLDILKSNLNCLAIFRNEKLRSLRDIDDYKPIENCVQLCMDFIVKTYGIERRHMLSYVHYHPSFWSFHIHFGAIGYLNSQQQGDHISSYKAILTDDIVDHLKADKDYYKNCSLTVKTMNSLYESFK